MRFLFCLLLCAASYLYTANAPAQDKPTVEAAAQESLPVEVRDSDDKFHRSVIKAAQKLVRDKKLSRLDMVKLRMAMLSPAFREKAQELAVLQMTCSGSDLIGTNPALPVDDDGTLIVASIDWDAIIAFIEKLIPLIMQLIQIFGGTAAIDFDSLSLAA
jgi:hypothetical protein